MPPVPKTQFETAKEMIESAPFADLANVTIRAMRLCHPMNGERADLVAVAICIAYGRGRFNRIND